MESLDALRRWNEKRTKTFEKLAKVTQRSTLPERKLKPMRLRPGEVGSREEFGSWMGALTPDAGAVNEFRKKMYQSELRGLHNRITLNHINPHPGWGLWTGNHREVMLSDPIYRQEQRILQKEELTQPPAHPGIQLFFQNYTNDAPLVGTPVQWPPVLMTGSGLSGGALTQLPRTARGYKKTEANVLEASRERARQLTAMRSGQMAAPAPPPVLTALDEAKLTIGTTLESIGQQLFRGLFSTDVLRDLTSVSATIARNAPLMDTPALGELYRYVSDLATVLRANAKNTGKEIAEDNLGEFVEEADIGADYWRGLLGRRGAPAQAEIRDLDKGVVKSQNLAEAIYSRLEAIADFIKKQYEASERPVAERIAIARSGLSALGTNVDRKTYPAALREKFRREEAERAKAERDAAEAAALARAGVAAPAGEFDFDADMPLPVAANPMEAVRLERERLIAQYLEEAAAAMAAGDYGTEEANLQTALYLAQLNGNGETVALISQAMVRRGYEVPGAEMAVGLAGEEEEGAEEEAALAEKPIPRARAAAEEEEEIAAPAARAEAAAAGEEEREGAYEAKIILTPDEYSQFVEALAADGSEPDQYGTYRGNAIIGRDGSAVEFVNDVIRDRKVKGVRIIQKTQTNRIPVKDLIDQLADKGFAVSDMDAVVPIRNAIRYA